MNVIDNRTTELSDPINDSLKLLLVISFSHSSSKNFPIALEIAQNRKNYREHQIAKTKIYFCGFEKSSTEAVKAKLLISFIKNWKGSQIFAGGKIIQNPYQADQILDCFITASSCRDHKAHCHQIVSDVYKSKEFTPSVFSLSFDPEAREEPKLVDQYLHPCSYLKSYHWKADSSHSSSLQDQFQALAVKRGVDWCPYFNAEDLKNIGTKLV